MTDWIEGLREMVSLLMAHGHPEARHYPVPMLWAETKVTRRRVNMQMAETAMLTQAAIASVLSDKGRRLFSDRIKKLTEAKDGAA